MKRFWLGMLVLAIATIACSFGNGSKAENIAKQADQLVETEKYAEAIELYNQALELDPESSHAYAGRGTAYRLLGNFQTALNDLNKAIQLDDRNHRAYRERGMISYSNGEYQTALMDCSKSVALKSDYGLGHLCLGYIYQALGQNKDAISEYTLTLNLESENKWALAYRGEIYFYEGQYQQSIDDLSQAIRLDSQWDEPYIYRGYVYLALKDYHRAIDDFNSTVALTTYTPYKANAYSRLGVCYFYIKEYQKAVEHFTLAIEVSPSDDVDAYYDIALRAMVYDEMGEDEKALKDYIQFLDLVPSDNETTRYACARANVLSVLGSENFLTFFLNLMIQPCTRFDVAGQTYGTDIPYEESAPIIFDRYYNRDTGRYQDSWCSNCSYEPEIYSP